MARHSPCGGRRSDNGCYVICGWGRAGRAGVVPVVPRAALPIHSKGAGCGVGLWQCSWTLPEERHAASALAPGCQSFPQEARSHAQASWARKTCFALSAQMAEHGENRRGQRLIPRLASFWSGFGLCWRLSLPRPFEAAPLCQGLRHVAPLGAVGFGLIPRPLCRVGAGRLCGKGCAQGRRLVGLCGVWCRWCKRVCLHTVRAPRGQICLADLPVVAVVPSGLQLLAFYGAQDRPARHVCGLCSLCGRHVQGVR